MIQYKYEFIKDIGKRKYFIKTRNFSKQKIIIFLILLLIAVPFVTFFSFYNKLNVTETDQSSYNSKFEKVYGITNILLLGTDERAGKLAYRSDCMMIANINTNNKNIKLTYLTRDTYVYISGKGKDKLNTAYFFGEKNLLFQTIEKNFHIKSDKYMQVDFDHLMNMIFLIDSIG